MVWGIFGNLSKEQAVSIADNALKNMNLAPVGKSDLNDYRMVQPPVGVSRLDFGLVDDKNDNSCYFTHFLLGLVDSNDCKGALMARMLNQYLQQPTFDELRTVQQLGYVVHAAPDEVRDVHSLKFIIQSPKYGCSHIRNSLDKHLQNMREKAANLTDDEFKTI